MRLLLSTIVLAGLPILPLHGEEKEANPAPAPAKAPNNKPPPHKGEPDKYVHVGVLGGIVQSAADARDSLVLRVTFRYLEPNVEAQKNYLRQHQQLLIRQQLILANPDFVSQQQQLAQLLRDAQQLMRTQKDLYNVKSVDKDVEVGLAEDVKVRSIQPATQFDDKGNIKRFTRQELLDLKGKDKLPGFAAELTDVQPGQTVLVRVMRHRAAKEAAKDGDAPPANKTAPAESASKASPSEPIHLGPHFVGTLVLIASDTMK
jgi:hypothetical protein